MVYFNSSDLIAKSNDAIVLINHRKVIKCNDAAMVLLGFQKGSFPDLTDDLFENFPFKYLHSQSFQKYINRTYQNGNNLFKFSPNQVIEFEVSLTLLNDHLGNSFIFSLWKKIDQSINQEKLQDVLKIANLATWEYKIKEGILLMNERFCELIGYNNPALIISGKEYLEKFVLAEDRGGLIQSLGNVIRSAIPDFQSNIECRLIKHGGGVVSVLCSTRKKNNSLFGTLQDITHLRKTEKELEEYRLNLEKLVGTRTYELKRSEEKLSDALSIAKLGTWEYDFSLKCFIVSDEVFKIIGTSKQKEGGTTISLNRFKSLLHPDDWHVFQRAAQRAIKSNDENYLDHFKYRIIKDDGEVLYLYFSLKIMLEPLSGYHYKHYGTLQDITHIIKSEAERQRLNEIIEVTTDIVAIIDKDENLYYLNKSGQKFFDIVLTEGNPYEKNDLVKLSNIVKSLLGDKLQTVKDEGIWNGENTIIGKDDQRTVVSQVIIPHVSDNGEYSYFSTIIRDISKQKKTELDLIFKNNELDTFVYRASHDLRGPLASLLGLYSVIKYEVKDSIALDYFEMINRQIIKLNGVILSLIELSKIKEIETRKTPIDFKELIKDSFESLKHLPNYRDVNFSIDINLSENFICDYDLTKIILTVLLENAISFSKPDGRPLVLVAVRELQSGNNILIEVKDNGIGIEKSIQTKVFNMFFRGHEKSKGSGLGLYLLKNAVDKLNGKVSLESDQYKGTTFKVELPNFTKSSLISL